MAYTTKIKTPDTDTWIDVFSGKNQIARYFHLFNADKTNPANIALAIYDTLLTELHHPSSAAVTPTGSTGSTKYEYFVTTKTSRGETDPLIIDPINDGYHILDSTNYHTIQWNSVSGGEVIGYCVYVKVNDLTWYIKEVPYEMLSVVNDGTWEFSSNPPWLNMTSISCLLDFEQIPPNSILEFSTDIEISSVEKIVFATTNSLINLYARAIDSAS